MICKKCSKEIPDDAKMCCYCGRKYIIERKNTKRAKGEGTAYKRGNTWTAQVTIGWKELPPLDLNIPENTKRRVQIHRTKGGFKTKNEALLYCRELMAQKEKPKAAPHLITYWKTYEDGSVDYDRFTEQIEYQIEGGADSIIVCGTTGESACLSHEEHTAVTKHCVDDLCKCCLQRGKLPKRVRRELH